MSMEDSGVCGKLALQIAKLLGAARVVGTGRNKASMRHAAELGVDAMIDLMQSEKQVVDAFAAESSD
jgi:NADPH2:quinone reductase